MRTRRGIGRTLFPRSMMLVGGVAIALGAGSASYSAASTQQAIPRFTIGIETSITTLDFPRTPSFQNFRTEAYGVEPLVVVGRDGRVQPHLAQSVANPNPRTYIYTLRKGVRFWDGTELTAADAANALNYYRDKSFIIASSGAWPSVRSIVAQGRYKVVVTLKRRDARWPESAASGLIFQKKFQQTHGADMGKPGVLTMGTGPWKFDRLDTQSVEMSANRRYWGGEVPIERLSVKFIPDQTTRAFAFRAGDIDIAAVIDPRAFTATSGKSVTTWNSCFVLHLGMNTKLAPWNNIRVRRAAAYAINRPEIITAAGGTSAAGPASTLIYPSLLRSIASKAEVDKLLKSLNTYPFSLQRARQELRQSPYPNGFSGTLTSLPFDPYPRIMEAIAGNLAKIGIRLDVDVITLGEWFAAGGDRKTPIFFNGINCESPDPGAVPDFYVHSKNTASGKANHANYSNQRADALIDEAAKTTSDTRRFALFSELLRILARDEPYIPLYNLKGGLAFSSKFTYPRRYTFDQSPDRRLLLGVRPK